MRILLTGASSFTGYWFADALVKNGHEVFAPLRRTISSYNDGARAERVRRLSDITQIFENVDFGDERFIEIVRDGKFDLLCHHAAQVGDYRSPNFDVVNALAANTKNLRTVLFEGAFRGLVLTGSVFEQGEGAGSAPLRAFSPYGLSKGLTAEIVAHYATEADIPYGKFVIPNPFGPLEEPRFVAYLMRTWKANNVATVNTPAYVRDNIHVGLLAQAYAYYVEEVATGKASRKFAPSGYVETQGAFTHRLAKEMRERLGLNCAVELADQTEFPEPVMRTNTQQATLFVSDWDERTAWDTLAESYRSEI